MSNLANMKSPRSSVNPWRLLPAALAVACVELFSSSSSAATLSYSSPAFLLYKVTFNSGGWIKFDALSNVLCVLGSVTGEWDRTGITGRPDTGYSGIGSGTAWCADLSKFNLPDDSQRESGAHTVSDRTDYQNLWQGDAFAFITDVTTGGFGGGGEQVWVTQASSATAYNWVQASAQDGSATGTGRAFFPGVWGTSHPVRVTLGGENASDEFVSGKYGESGKNFDFHVSSKGSGESDWNYAGQGDTMIPVGKGLCALTRVSGEFKSRSDSLEIVLSDGRWLLVAWQGLGRAYGSARCIAYAQ